MHKGQGSSFQLNSGFLLNSCVVFLYFRCFKVVELQSHLQHDQNAHPKSQEAARGPSAPTHLRRSPPLLQAPTWTDWWGGPEQNSTNKWISGVHSKEQSLSRLNISSSICKQRRDEIKSRERGGPQGYLFMRQSGMKRLTLRKCRGSFPLSSMSTTCVSSSQPRRQGGFRSRSDSPAVSFHLHTGYWAQGATAAHDWLLGVPPTDHLQRREASCRRHK